MNNTEVHHKTNGGKITEALDLLNEAAREKKDELKGLFTDKYSHIKQTMVAQAQQGRRVFDKTKDLAQETFQGSEEKIKETLSDVDKRVRKDPWAYIAGATAISVLLGYLMGTSKRK